MDDSYFLYVEEQWSNIVNLYAAYKDKSPIMLFDIQEQKIYAYPYHGFLVELSSRSQKILIEQFAVALANSKIVIFVRDNENRRLVFYTVPMENAPEKTESKPRKARRQSKVRPKRSSEENAEP